HLLHHVRIDELRKRTEQLRKTAPPLGIARAAAGEPEQDFRHGDGGKQTRVARAPALARLLDDAGDHRSRLGPDQLAKSLVAADIRAVGSSSEMAYALALEQGIAVGPPGHDLHDDEACVVQIGEQAVVVAAEEGRPRTTMADVENGDGETILENGGKRS